MQDKTVTPGGIRVPQGYQHLVKKVRPTGYKDPDYRKACVRDYIKEHDGEVMTTAQFAVAAYGSENSGGMAAKLLTKLRKEGRITRIKVKTGTRGVSYTYKWHEQRLPKDPSRSDGEVRLVGHVPVAGQETPAIQLSGETLDTLSQAAVLEFSRHAESDSHIAGAVKFVNWLRDEHAKKEVERG